MMAAPGVSSPGQQGPGPVVAATGGLVDWLASVTGTPVRVGPPEDAPDAGTAALLVWPLELRPDGETVGAGRRAPMRLRLRCLVCPVGPAAAADLLDRALLAAAAAGEPALALEPPAPETWLALGVRPRPVLVLDVPVRVARPTPDVPLVRAPIELRAVPVRAVRGRVVGPAEVPLGGMRVEVAGAGAGQSTYTGPDGGFALAGVPATGSARLRLDGRGRQLLAEIDASSTEPVVIHCDIEES